MRAHPPSGTKIGINTSAPCIKFVFYCPKPGQGLKICLSLFLSDYRLFFQVTAFKELFSKPCTLIMTTGGRWGLQREMKNSKFKM